MASCASTPRWPTTSRSRTPPASRSASARRSTLGRGPDPLPARERHGTPFEHNAFRFHIRCPIFVAREWFRHRIGSFNELSGRYKELDGDFYVPAAADVRSQVGKPGAYSFEPVDAELAERTRTRSCRRIRPGLRRVQARSSTASQGDRARRPSGRRLHRVLLDGERALPHELHLAPQRRDGAARDPPVRRGVEEHLAGDADHARRVRRQRPHRALRVPRGSPASAVSSSAPATPRRCVPGTRRTSGSRSRSGAGTSSRPCRERRPSGRSSRGTPATGHSSSR